VRWGLGDEVSGGGVLVVGVLLGVLDGESPVEGVPRVEALGVALLRVGTLGDSVPGEDVSVTDVLGEGVLGVTCSEVPCDGRAEVTFVLSGWFAPAVEAVLVLVAFDVGVLGRL
jgi:hypothetical protein